MSFSAKVLCDSLVEADTRFIDTAPESRLMTMELTYPRCIHSEFMTHRAFSRNAASSREIPISKMIADVQNNPFVPLSWGKNQKGRQAGEELDLRTREMVEEAWLAARRKAVEYAQILNAHGLHKQIVNRILEPWMWITVIATGTDKAWENFFNLRCHKDAEPHMQELAYLARDAYDTSKPNVLHEGCIHAPLFDDCEYPASGKLVCKVSTGRCARVSYLTHDGRRDANEDIRLHDRLAASGHWSPFEHVATVADTSRPNNKGGNFGTRWIQYRKEFPNENCAKAPRNKR